MRVRAGTGWQYALADLSLILFLVTAAALAQAQGSARAKPPPVLPAMVPPIPVAAAYESEPVAVWRAGAGAPALRSWLDQVGADARLEVRIVVRYTGEDRMAGIGKAVQLAEAGGPRARSARILVEPGEVAGASVALLYAREIATAGPAARRAAPLAR
jgi:hypothetical protein